MAYFANKITCLDANAIKVTMLAIHAAGRPVLTMERERGAA